MKIQEIKTELFTRVNKTSYGWRFEDYTKVTHNEYMVSVINVLPNGRVNILPNMNYASLSNEQLNEITRVSNLLKEKTE